MRFADGKQWDAIVMDIHDMLNRKRVAFDRSLNPCAETS